MNLKQEYIKWKEIGRIPYKGLCLTLRLTKYYKTLMEIEPTYKERELLKKENKDSVYWGYGEINSDIDLSTLSRELTPLRETIILLILAIHGELQ